MKSLVVLMFLAFVATIVNGCSNGPEAPTMETASADFCVQVCAWADKCGQYAPDACGDLCSAPSCEDACKADVAVLKVPTEMQLGACLEGVDASARDCTAYRPDPADCAEYFTY